MKRKEQKIFQNKGLQPKEVVFYARKKWNNTSRRQDPMSRPISHIISRHRFLFFSSPTGCLFHSCHWARQSFWSLNYYSRLNFISKFLKRSFRSSNFSFMINFILQLRRKKIVLVLKLCILGSISSINYQSAFNFYFQLNFVYSKRKLYILGTISSINYQNYRYAIVSIYPRINSVRCNCNYSHRYHLYINGTIVR